MAALVTLQPVGDANDRWIVVVDGLTVGVLEHEQHNSFFLLLSHPNPKELVTQMVHTSESVTELLAVAQDQVPD
jgi:hypothetical protein